MRIVLRCDELLAFLLVQMIFIMLKSITHVGNDKAQPVEGVAGCVPPGSATGSGIVPYTRFSLRLHY